MGQARGKRQEIIHRQRAARPSSYKRSYIPRGGQHQEEALLHCFVFDRGYERAESTLLLIEPMAPAAGAGRVFGAVHV